MHRLLAVASWLALADASGAEARLVECRAFETTTLAGELIRIPDGARAFAPSRFFAWGIPGTTLQELTPGGRMSVGGDVIGEATVFVRGTADGGVVFSTPEGLSVSRQWRARKVAGEGATTPVVAGDAIYYVREGAIRVRDADGDRVVIAAGSPLFGKHRAGSFALHAGGSSIGVEARADTARIGRDERPATILGWLSAGKLVDPRVVEFPIGTPGLVGDTYVFVDNEDRTRVYAMKRGEAPRLLFSTRAPIDDAWRFDRIVEVHWDGGPLFVKAYARGRIGVYRIDGCKLSEVAVGQPGPFAESERSLSMIHRFYADSVKADRAIILKQQGASWRSYLYDPTPPADPAGSRLCTREGNGRCWSCAQLTFPEEMPCDPPLKGCDGLCVARGKERRCAATTRVCCPGTGACEAPPIASACELECGDRTGDDKNDRCLLPARCPYRYQLEDSWLGKGQVNAPTALYEALCGPLPKKFPKDRGPDEKAACGPLPIIWTIHPRMMSSGGGGGGPGLCYGIIRASQPGPVYMHDCGTPHCETLRYCSGRVVEQSCTVVGYCDGNEFIPEAMTW